MLILAMANWDNRCGIASTHFDGRGTNLVTISWLIVAFGDMVSGMK
jgi:hypothetical protein